MEDVTQEWSARVEYALSRGLRAPRIWILTSTSIISLRFIRSFSSLPLAIKIKYVRAAREFYLPNASRGPMSYRVLSRLAQSLARRARAARVGTPDWFYGLARTGHRNSAAWIALLRQVPPAPVKSWSTSRLHHRSHSRTNPAHRGTRATELDALINPQVKDALIRQNIQLTHYGKI